MANTTSRPSAASREGVCITRRSALRLALAAGVATLFQQREILADEYEASQETLNALADAENEADSIQGELNEIGAQIQELAEEYETTLAQVEELSSRIDEKAKEIENTESDIEATKLEIEAAENDIEQKQAEIKVAQERLSARMVSAYKAGSQGFIDLLLSSATFEELSSNIYYLDKLSSSDGEIIGDIKELKGALEEQKAALERQKQSLEEKKQGLERARTQLENDRADLETIKLSQEEQLDAMREKQAEVAAVLADVSDQVAALISQRDSEILEAKQEAERLAAARQSAQSQGSTDTSWYSNPSVSSGTTGSQQAVINAAYSTPTAGAGLCAAWVTYVFMNAGVGSFSGNACDMYWWYCTSSNLANLAPGMIIAVPSHPHSSAGSIYGHVGVYVGNGTVRHNIGYIATWSVSEWISYYGASTTPRWGWLGGVALA